MGYEWSELDKSALFLELLPIINSGAIELLDDDHLLRELRGLERRRGSSGRDRIDHRPGDHDDRANAVAGVANLLGYADEEVPMVAGVCVMREGVYDPAAPWLGTAYSGPSSDDYFPPSFRRWDR